MEDKYREFVSAFCSHCDYVYDKGVCSDDDRFEYAVKMRFCIWSEIQGVKVFSAKENTLGIGVVEYFRSEPGKIMEAVAREKASKLESVRVERND